MSFERPSNEEMEKKAAEVVGPDQAKSSEYREVGVGLFDPFTREISTSFSYDKTKDLINFKYAGHSVEIHQFSSPDLRLIFVDGIQVPSGSSAETDIFNKFVGPLEVLAYSSTEDAGKWKKLKEATADLLGDTSK